MLPLSLIHIFSVSCEYRTMTHFGETVAIAVALTKYNGIRLELAYTVSSADTGEVRAVGSSKHCFLDRDGNIPVSYTHLDVYKRQPLRRSV